MKRRKTLGNESDLEPLEEGHFLVLEIRILIGQGFPSADQAGMGVVCQPRHKRPEFLPQWLFLLFHWLTHLPGLCDFPSDCCLISGTLGLHRSWEAELTNSGWDGGMNRYSYPFAPSLIRGQGSLSSESEETVHQEVSQDGANLLCLFIGQLFPEWELYCLFSWSRFFIVTSFWLLETNGLLEEVGREVY